MPPKQLVQLLAQRFHFTPREFAVTAGQPLVAEITSVEFIHGFSIPELKTRTDLLPATLTKIRLTIEQPGTCDFHCGNFCGGAHEEMNGRMVARR